jgi:hypothetical protein
MGEPLLPDFCRKRHHMQPGSAITAWSAAANARRRFIRCCAMWCWQARCSHATLCSYVLVSSHNI